MEAAPKPETLRKKIRVRKNTSPDLKIRNYEDEYHIPIAAQDSKWSGIAFTKQEMLESTTCGTEDECEIKIIDLDSDTGTPPLLILFPDLRNEESSEHLPAVSENLSTSSLTKLLRGKKPKMDLMKTSKKIKTMNRLDTLKEDSSHTSPEEHMIGQNKPASVENLYGGVNGIQSESVNDISKKTFV